MAKGRTDTASAARAFYSKNRPNAALLGTFAFAGMTLVVIAAILSPAMGIFVLGFLGLTAVVAMESSRRKLWEQAFSFRLQRQENNHDALSQEVNRQRQDLGRVKQHLAETGLRLDEQERKLQDYRPPAPKPAAAPQTEQPHIVEEPAPVLRAEYPLTGRAYRPRSYKAMRSDFFIPEPDDQKPLALNPHRHRTAAGSAGMRRTAPKDSNEYSDLSDVVLQELLHHAVRHERVDVFLQPVMRLPQRKIRAYEMFARIRARPGVYLPANQYMKVAQQESLIHNIDHLLLMQCLETVAKTAHIDRAAPFMLNVTQGTLKNPAYMKRLLNFLAQHRNLAPRLIFEIPQTDYTNLKPAILQILQGLGTLGCGLSLDHIVDLNLNVEDLMRYKVRFVKIDAAALQDHARRESDYAGFMRLKRKLEANGIGVIVERVESEETLKSLWDFELNYGQGYLFGKPDVEGAYRERRIA